MEVVNRLGSYPGTAVGLVLADETSSRCGQGCVRGGGRRAGSPGCQAALAYCASAGEGCQFESKPGSADVRAFGGERLAV